MTVREVFANAIQPLLIERDSNSPTFIRERVVRDINAAMQTLATGLEYFTQEAMTAEIPAANTTVELPEDILNVFPPFLLADGSGLALCETRGELDHFAQIFRNRKTADAAGRPRAIFVDKSVRAGNANSVRTRLIVTPQTNAAYTISFDASRRPARYTVADLSDPSPTIPIPHAMTESIFLPIVRWNVRTSHFFNRPDLLPSMEQEWKAALTQLGIAEPTESRDTQAVLERKKAAARAAAREAYANA